MSLVARKALQKLLVQAENAAGKGSAPRAITLRFTEASFPDYLAVRSHADKVECNGALSLAQVQGAIRIQWDSRSGDKGQIERIELVDREALAAHMGVTPRWTAIETAAAAFEKILPDHPVVNDVLASWRRGIQVRSTKVFDTSVWIDAAAVIAACREQQGLDIPVRRLSAKLFSDSKHIQAIASAIDILLLGSTSLPTRDPEEVFGEIGLVKYPPTLLVSGKVEVESEGERISIASPYLGLAPLALQSATAASSTRTLLTVENLTTFHELAGKQPRDRECIVLYTGGMPSPSWKRVYTMLLRTLPEHARIFHWGDIDAGGFRIASHLASVCESNDRQLTLHSMNSVPTGIPHENSRKTLSAAEINQVLLICNRWGWSTESEGVGLAIEQESLPITWPL